MGSVHYISPEQAKGDETDFTSDLYSVGVMMYEMLSGHLPFDADDVVEVAIKQISDQPRSLRELAPWVPVGWWRSPSAPWQSGPKTAIKAPLRCWKPQRLCREPGHRVQLHLSPR